MYWKISPVAFFLCGCQLTISDDPGSSASAVSAQIGTLKQYEITMAAEWRKEDRILQFISRGEYSCGYPDSPEVREIVDVKKKTKQIEDRYNLIKGSIDVINDYAKALKSTQDGVKKHEKDIKILAASVKLFSRLPGAPNADALVAAGQAIALSANAAAASISIATLANVMQEPLESSAIAIKAWYPAQNDAAGRLFNQWDSCALEKLYYIRDVSNGLIKGDYESYISRATGTELDVAFQQYLEKREKFRRPGAIDKKLEAMLEQNRQLIESGSFEAANRLADLIVTLDENLQ